jgi:hypothetical protein
VLTRKMFRRQQKGEEADGKADEGAAKGKKK